MLSVADFLAFPASLTFQVLRDLNIYDSPRCDRLATQAARGRWLRLEPPEMGLQPEDTAWVVRLLEDGYPGWLDLADLSALYPGMYGPAPYLNREQIEPRLAAVIAYAHAAMAQPNRYLWGGTVAPDYDCSGLMQAAFQLQGIWLPRDAYQQEAFLQPIALGQEGLPGQTPEGSPLDWSALLPGDLVFFGTPQKATHVGLYLGEGRYIHSSGQEIGRNGIGIDVLSGAGDAPAVSQRYYQQFRGAGRVMRSYRP